MVVCAVPGAAERDHEIGAPCRRACLAGIDIPRCHRLLSRCHTCQVVRSLAYTGAFNPARARIVVGSGKGTLPEGPRFTEDCVHCPVPDVPMILTDYYRMPRITGGR